MAQQFADLQPRETVMVGNISQKVPHNDLKKLLFELFSPYGRIIDINVKRVLKQTHRPGVNKQTKKLYDKHGTFMKITAFIVFENTASSILAKKLHKFDFFGRPLFVQFAKEKSDITAMIDGTFKKDKMDKATREKMEGKKDKKVVIKKILKQSLVGEISSSIVIENCEEEWTIEIMRPLFTQFPGLVDLREGESKMHIDFKHEDYATQCLKELQGFKIENEKKMQLVYDNTSN